MKSIFTLFLFVLSIQFLFGQQTNKASGVSKKVFISVTKTPPKPPLLKIENYSFSDINGNNKIDADEKVELQFDLINLEKKGYGPGKGLSLNVKETNNLTGLEFKTISNLPELNQGESRTITIPIEGKMELEDGIASFVVEVREPNGFGTDPWPVNIKTQSFRAPEVKLVDYVVSSQTGTSTLKKKEIFELQVVLQNIGQGTAKDVSILVKSHEDILRYSGNELQQIGDLEPGEDKIISYSYIARNNFQGDTMNFEFAIEEKYGEYAEDKLITLQLNQEVALKGWNIEGTDEVKFDVEIASLSSDVDKNIPVINEKHPNKFALIFGNEDYSGTLDAEDNVPFARHDADVFRKYAIRTLGIQEQHIFFTTDATLGTMNTQIGVVTELIKRNGAETELVFYYAGHGFPNEKSHAPYLIPVDSNGHDPESAIALKEVYKKLGDTGAKKITVILDACFSGGGRKKGLLAARGVRIKPKEEELSGNMVVFSASSGAQTALPYDEQRHGLYTYFLLKKLQETSGKVTFGELDNYLRKKVGTTSLLVNGKTQDPETNPSPDIINEWKKMTF